VSDVSGLTARDLAARDLAAQVTAALERSILPTAIARGAVSIRVVAAGEDGAVTLEVAGSPGAVLPMLTGIEAQIRAAVPGVTTVRLAAPASAPAQALPGAGGDLADAAQCILDAEVNPAIAAHRGHVAVADADGGWIRIRLEGGCQGCSLAEVTIRQGIEPLLRERLPGVTGVADITDHEAGTDPFFSPAKR
jgi:Fe-S cluster biogenesis protein NfuA